MPKTNKKVRTKTMMQVDDDDINDDNAAVVFNPMQMHTVAVSENQHHKAKWQNYFRTEVLPEQRYGLVTRLLYTCPEKSKTIAILSQVFPVLENAAIANFELGFAIQRARFQELGNVDLQFCAGFDTQHNGRLFIVAVSCLSPDLDPTHCTLRIGRLLDDHTLTMTNTDAKKYLFMVSLVVPFTGCQLCSQIPDATDTRSHMRKCGRCWSTRHFPVWYCGRKCQRLDYNRHVRCDGCKEGS